MVHNGQARVTLHAPSPNAWSVALEHTPITLRRVSAATYECRDATCECHDAPPPAPPHCSSKCPPAAPCLPSGGLPGADVGNSDCCFGHRSHRGRSPRPPCGEHATQYLVTATALASGPAVLTLKLGAHRPPWPDLVLKSTPVGRAVTRLELEYFHRAETCVDDCGLYLAWVAPKPGECLAGQGGLGVFH